MKLEAVVDKENVRATTAIHHFFSSLTELRRLKQDLRQTMGSYPPGMEEALYEAQLHLMSDRREAEEHFPNLNFTALSMLANEDQSEINALVGDWRRINRGIRPDEETSVRLQKFLNPDYLGVKEMNFLVAHSPVPTPGQTMRELIATEQSA